LVNDLPECIDFWRAKSVVKSDILTTVHEQYINSWHPESQTLTRLASRTSNFTMLNRQVTRRAPASEPRVHTGVSSGNQSQTETQAVLLAKKERN